MFLFVGGSLDGPGAVGKPCLGVPRLGELASVDVIRGVKKSPFRTEFNLKPGIGKNTKIQSLTNHEVFSVPWQKRPDPVTTVIGLARLKEESA